MLVSRDLSKTISCPRYETKLHLGQIEPFENDQECAKKWLLFLHRNNYLKPYNGLQMLSIR